MQFRTGFGYDVHPLSEGYDLWLGGVKIPSDKGAVGHSDADVLLHAICDAMLGALALGDIGHHFPDTDQKYKGIDSKILLRHVNELILSKGYRLNNLDASLALESPKIKPFIPEMQKAIAEILRVETDAVSIKATTNEKLGYVGRKEGVNAFAVVMLVKD
jgi:2-C-methyl-D-erythritol 2,4-cyclodiphosphate synthase